MKPRGNVFLSLSLTVCFVLVFLADSPAAAQEGRERIESSDLTELWATTETELLPLATEVEEKCRSLEQVRSVPLFTDLIERVDALEAGGELREDQKGWRRRALFCRAEALFNLRRGGEAEADLRRLYELDPGFEPAAGEASPRLVELAKRVRNLTIGALRFVPTPPDAEIEIDDSPMTFGVEAEVSLPAGPHRVRATRPGFGALDLRVDVVAGRSQVVDLLLERTSAVLDVWTSPCDVLVSLDGAVVGSTVEPRTGTALSPETPPSDRGCRLRVDGLEIGPHVVELTRRGHRGVRASFEVEQLVDFALPLQRLRPTGGAVVLNGVRPGSSVRVDDVEQVGLTLEVDRPLRLELDVGRHRIEVAYDTVGFFAADFALADKETKEIAVELRPHLAFLGVIGGDPEASADLEAELSRSLAALERMSFGSAGCRADDVLPPFGITPDRLLELAAGEPAPPVPWDESDLQAALDSRCRASAYLLAVLPPATFPDRADLWIWSAAPGPAKPSVHRLGLPAAEALVELGVALDQPTRFSRNWLGARFIDSLAETGPVVLSVAAEGPAAGAGLRAGDRLVSWQGEEVLSRRQLRDLVDRSPPEQPVEIAIARGGVTQTVPIQPAVGARVISASDSRLHPAAVAGQLALRESLAPRGIEPWVAELNWAAVFLLAEDWGRAARRLGTIEAPAGPGVGQAVADYWFARALQRDAGSAYRQRVLEALRRAAGATETRLDDHDGPLVGPRARLFLAALESSEN